jgi:hypothetical protein
MLPNRRFPSERVEPETPDEDAAILAFVDELARFAAEQWLAGKLDHFPAVEELPLDDDDE